MEPMISVIIPEFEDDTYLIRCLNSLKRQTYKSLEIIIADDACDEKIRQAYGVVTVGAGDYWEKLNSAIKISKGEYIFFYDVNSVMGTNVLYSLQENTTQNILYYAQCVYQKGDQFVPVENDEFSIYGKLFRKDFLRKERIMFQKKSVYPELEFVIEYLKMYESAIPYEGKYVYMKNKQLIRSDDISIGDIEEFLNSIYIIEPEKLENLLFRVLEFCEPNNQMEIMLILAKYQTEEWNLNYKVAEKYLWNLYRECLNSKDENIFQSIKKYLGIFQEKKYFLRVLLNLIKLDEKQLGVLLQVPLEEYLFLQDKFEVVFPVERINMPTKSENQNLSILEKELKVIEQKIDNIKIEPKYVEKEVIVDKELSGPALAEDVVEKYRQGRLGLKTIIRSLCAWFKYKM